MAAVTDENESQVVGYSYDADGNLSERTVLRNNLTATYTYDYQNHLTAMKNQTGSVGVISEYSLEYLANGQKSRETSGVIDKDGKKTKKTVLRLFFTYTHVVKKPNGTTLIKKFKTYPVLSSLSSKW